MNEYVTEVFDKFDFTYRLISCQAHDENEARQIVNDNINRSFDVIYRVVKIKECEENGNN